jgi:PHS family inorganic phosphate transporter-like MFS transporter
MLGLVYWNNNIPQRDNVLIGLSLLVGTMFGQFLFGILGDRYGRRRLYGYELLVLTFATILMSLVSKGALHSSSKVVWIVAWRFFMGIGIGGDYPLSATIVAEYVFA